MKSIEIEKKKVDDAIKEGLALMDTTLDNVDIEIISQGGFFKKAKIRMTLVEPEEDQKSQPQKEAAKPQRPTDASYKENVRQSGPARHHEPAKPAPPEKKSPANPPPSGEMRRERPQEDRKAPPAEKNAKKAPPAKPENHREKPSRPQEPKRQPASEITAEIIEKARTFVTMLIEKMGFSSDVKAETRDGDLYLDIISDSGSLIGYRGETLDAIEYLTSIHLNRNSEQYTNLIVDCCNYRNKREKMLASLAEKMAEKCMRTGRKVIMEPMNRSGRKIVHSTLGNYEKLITKSEGIEPNRHIVIFYKRDNQK